MGAYYNWLNQQRAEWSARSSFIAWFEGHETAIAIDRQCREDGFQFARDVRKILEWTYAAPGVVR